MVAASSLLTPSFTVLGAPSTRSFASFRPRLVTSRTALMTLILLPPTSVRTTVNSVFSSAGAAAPPPAGPAATTVAAAADTPKASSIFFTRSDASSNVRPLISSRIVSTFDMTASSPLKFLMQNYRNRGGPNPLSPRTLRTELVGLDRFAHGYREIARQRIERAGDPLCRSVQQEHNLADKFFLGRHVRQLLDLRNRDHAAFDNAGLELERRNILGDLGQCLRQRDRIGQCVGNGMRALQVLEHVSRGCSRAGEFRERVFYNLILPARCLHRTAQLGVFFNGDPLEGGENNRRHLREFRFQLVQVLLFFALLLHNLSPPAGRRYAAAARISASARSTVIPGPIVEVSVIRFTYLPLAAAGFALITAAITAWAFSASLGASKLILPIGQCTIPALSTRNSTLPALVSFTALVTSAVTVPVFGLGIRPRGPSTLPSLPAERIMSGVAITASKSVQPSMIFWTISSPPTNSAPASVASRCLSPPASTRTRTLLPKPFGRTTVPRTTWSECFGSTPRLIASSTVSLNFV